jgi:flagellar protein FliL
MKQTALALLIVTALAGASGGFYGYRIAAPGPAHAETDAHAQATPPAATLQPNSSVFDLPAIVTNLGNPEDTWIRLEASLVYDAKVNPHPEALGGQIADDILAFLRTTSLTQIQGIAGLQNLRLDINERAAIRSNGSVKEIVIRSLVIQ